MLPFDALEAKPYTDRLSEDEMDASWQWIESDGTRRMKTPAAIRLIETLPALRWMGPGIHTLRLYWLVGLVNGFFNLIRVKAGKVVPDVQRTVRWP